MLRGLIVANHNHLRVRTEQMNGGNAVGSSEDADLFGESGEDLESFLCLLAIAVLVGVAVQS